jgi:hypothetical protein
MAGLVDSFEVVGMASLKSGARRSRQPQSLAVLALAALGLGAACYATTPHVAQVSTASQADANCAVTTDAIRDVFARSGFVQLPRRGQLSMLFGARTGGPYSSFLTTGSGVGVNVERATDGTCHVAIQAVSPDASCPGNEVDSSELMGCQQQGAPSTPVRLSPSFAAPSGRLCAPLPTLTCELTYAPGADNDAAVDELARRVQAELGARGRIN